MSRTTQPQDQPGRTNRRGMLKHSALASVLGMTALGKTARAQDPSTGERTVKNGRIKQSIVYWCFEKYWDMEQAAKIAKQLGCERDIAYIHEMLRMGTGADRQLKVYEETGDLKKVVDYIVAETRVGVMQETAALHR